MPPLRGQHSLCPSSARPVLGAFFCIASPCNLPGCTVTKAMARERCTTTGARGFWDAACRHLWSPLPRPILTSPKNADLQMHHGRCIWGYAVSQPLWAMHGALRKTTGNHRCDGNTFFVATDAYRNPPSNCRYFIPLHFLYSTSVNYVENVAAVPGLLFQHGKVEGA